MDDKDLIAMVAMLGLVMHDGYTGRDVAGRAYNIAEAMMHEREERNGDVE